MSDENFHIHNDFKLEQNYPNPFNPTTKIIYTVGDAFNASPTTNIVLKIYDILGNLYLIITNIAILARLLIWETEII